jgi:hypothetical protein
VAPGTHLRSVHAGTGGARDAQPARCRHDALAGHHAPSLHRHVQEQQHKPLLAHLQARACIAPSPVFCWGNGPGSGDATEQGCSRTMQNRKGRTLPCASSQADSASRNCGEGASYSSRRQYSG